MIHLPQSPISNLNTLEITSEHECLLQSFFEENPEYFLAVQGEPAHPHEAREEISGQLPDWLTFSQKWIIGYLDETGSIVAIANIISNFLVAGVWHIGLFMVATSLYGTGQSQILYHSLESWAISNGANWLRIGVVKGNLRAENFWKRLGYIQIRTRDGFIIGRQTNILRIMVKPLAGGTRDQYLAMIERDRPEAML